MHHSYPVTRGVPRVGVTEDAAGRRDPDVRMGPVTSQPYAVRRAIAHVRELSAGPALDPTLRVTLNFHPDRLVGGEPRVAVMARDGVYRSQFETGTSNGGLTAHPGGDRWRWESRLFEGRYDAGPAADRPVYGA